MTYSNPLPVHRNRHHEYYTSMEDPLCQAFPMIIRQLLSGSVDDCRHVVMTHFTSNCSVQHPLYRIRSAENSRDTVCQIFSSRAQTFKSVNLVNQSIAFDESNDKLFCDLTRTVSLSWLPLTSANLRSIVILHLSKSNTQFFRVQQWEEFLQPDDVSALLFLPGARAATNSLRSMAAVATSLSSRWTWSPWSSQ